MDDTDSPEGMCTTYLATIAIESLERAGCKIHGFPRLIRLNPTVPFKTRGNGAVSFLVECENIDVVMGVLNETILNLSELEHKNTDPGVVFVDDERLGLINTLSTFGMKAVRDVVSVDEALFLIGKHKIPHLKYKKGRGLIGALAAVGVDSNDYTYELLAYRQPERFGKPREVDEDSFFRADRLTYPLTWDTVDWHNRVVVCVPGGPDPVLYGIRGSDFKAIYRAAETVITEPVEREMLFITNHSTDMHIISEEEIEEIIDYHSYEVRGKVEEEPSVMRGGHVFFTISTKFGTVKCAAFEPTKQFRDIILRLRKGDMVRVFGSVKKNTLNLEKIEIIKLVKEKELNPICPVCGKRMESAGRNQAYRCRKCKTKSDSKIKEKIERDIDEGFYEVPPCARRHLAKPLIRMSVPNKNIFR